MFSSNTQISASLILQSLSCVVLWIWQTCGSLAGQDSCSESPCGGLGCADSEGRTRCGGDGCDGVVTKAHSSLQKAQDSEQEILSAMEEVERLSKMVRC